MQRFSIKRSAEAQWEQNAWVETLVYNSVAQCSAFFAKVSFSETNPNRIRNHSESDSLLNLLNLKCIQERKMPANGLV